MIEYFEQHISLLKNPLITRWGLFLIKAAILLGLLFLFCKTAPSLPPVLVAVAWAALSIVSAIGLAYHVVIKKALKQFALEQDGRFSKLNNRRNLTLVIAFSASAACIAGLILEASKWSLTEWLLIAAAVPLYLFISLIINRIVSKELKPLFRNSRVAVWSSLFVGALLCIAYIVFLLVEPSVTYSSTAEAFTSAQHPFEGSSTALLSEAGILVGLTDGLSSFGMTKVAEFSVAGYVIWKIVLCGSAFFVTTNLISICSLQLGELKRIFLPVDTANEKKSSFAYAKKYVVTSCLLPIVLVAGFMVANYETEKAIATEEYTKAESFVRDQVGVAAYVLDGKYYDHQAVQGIIEDVKTKSNNLFEEAENALTPLINDVCDKQIDNVDSYLDWYYSLPADYDRLIQTFTGTIEAGMEAQLSEKINAGIDDSELTTQLQYYIEQAESLESDLMTELNNHELADIPDWLIVDKEPTPEDLFSAPLEPSHRLLSFEQRFGISTVTGAVAGVVVTRVTAKIIAKPVFNKLVSRLTAALASRGIAAAAGTLVAPGVGTAIGIAAGFGGDYLLLKVDERMNREENRQEMVDAIEEGRAEMLGLFQVSS